MPLVWSALVVAGLLVLVYLMIAGVPHPRLPDGTMVRHPKLLLPLIGAFLTAVGMAGYLTEGSLRVLGIQRWLVVFLVGGAAALVAAWLILRVFSAPSADPEDDPRYRFQGQVARVSEAIGADRFGRITFEVDGRRFDLKARAVDNGPVPVGTEVVIEQIDGEVATIEPWAAVEQRL